MELRTTVVGLQQEVSIERAQRGCKEKFNQEVFQLWQEKQWITEEKATELQSALQAKDAQLLKLTQTMILC